MKEIYIRKMRYEEARYKLERELQDAFMEGFLGRWQNSPADGLCL